MVMLPTWPSQPSVSPFVRFGTRRSLVGRVARGARRRGGSGLASDPSGGSTATLRRFASRGTSPRSGAGRRYYSSNGARRLLARHTRGLGSAAPASCCHDHGCLFGRRQERPVGQLKGRAGTNEGRVCSYGEHGPSRPPARGAADELISFKATARRDCTFDRWAQCVDRLVHDRFDGSRAQRRIGQIVQFDRLVGV